MVFKFTFSYNTSLAFITTHILGHAEIAKKETIYFLPHQSNAKDSLNP